MSTEFLKITVDTLPGGQAWRADAEPETHLYILTKKKTYLHIPVNGKESVPDEGSGARMISFSQDETRAYMPIDPEDIDAIIGFIAERKRRKSETSKRRERK